MIESYIEQQTDWMLQRVGKFTASECHKLFVSGKGGEYFGKGAQTYIRTKLAEVLTGQSLEITNNAMEWGNSLELEAVLLFEKVKGKRVEYYGKGNPRFFEYGESAGSSPDGLVDEEGIIEVKCPYNSAYHVMYLFIADAEDLKKEQFEYYAQIQMNLLCTERKTAWFISYDPRMIETKLKLRIIEISRDEEFITELKERLFEATKLLTVYRNVIDE